MARIAVKEYVVYNPCKLLFKPLRSAPKVFMSQLLEHPHTCRMYVVKDFPMCFRDDCIGVGALKRRLEANQTSGKVITSRADASELAQRAVESGCFFADDLWGVVEKFPVAEQGDAEDSL